MKKGRLCLAALVIAALLTGQSATGLLPDRQARAAELRALEESNQIWEQMLDSYNEKWTGQSENCSDSMPVGGGNLALNVWAEGDEVLFYLGSTDSIDENLVLEKLGRIRIRMSPNPFTGGLYTQELKLRQGYIEITGNNADNTAKIDIWVDIFNGTVNVEIENDQPTTVTAVYENWRTEDNTIELPSYEEEYMGGKYMFKDTFRSVDNGRGLMFYHRNRSDVALYEDLVEQQGLSQYMDQLINPLENYTFGGLMMGTNMVLLDETYEDRYASTDFTAWQMRTTAPQKSTTIKIYTLFDNYASENDFIDDLIAREAADAADRNARRNTENWWSEFWARSYVLPNFSCTDRSDNLWQVGRHYAMTRHQAGCYAFARFPSKFNGGPFSFDPEFSGSGHFQEEVTYGTPDFRFWGGGNATAQNQRCLTWPMLRSGDWEIMTSQFDYYKNGLNNNKIATKHYWDHDGAAFCEHLTPYGLAPGNIYGWDRPLHLEEGKVQASVYDQYNNQIEFSYQILLYHDYSGEDIGEYIDFITSSIKFFYEHYTRENLKNTGSMFDENGKLVIAPSRAMETFKNAVNPVDVIASLHVVVDRLIALSAEYPEIDRAYFENMKSRLPAVKYTYSNGKKIILVADSCGPAENFELPELAPLWPYGYFNIGDDNIEIARNTWDSIPGEMGNPLTRKGNADWEQTGIIAARLGLTDVAGEYLLDRMKDCDYFRYPGFKVIEAFDWSPNFESSSVGMSNAQEMILQDYGDDLYLLPAWRSDWELNAKLHAAFGTSVTLTQNSSGKIEFLKVEQCSSARESLTLHFRGIADPAVKVFLDDGSEVAVKRGEDSITFSVSEGQSYYVTGIPAAGLDAPENVSADKINGEISSRVELAWTPDPRAVSYRIYRKDTLTDELERVGETEHNSFVDEGLSESLGYYYQVTAINAEGSESLPSSLTPAQAKYLNDYFTEDFESGEVEEPSMSEPEITQDTKISDLSAAGNDADILAVTEKGGGSSNAVYQTANGLRGLQFGMERYLQLSDEVSAAIDGSFVFTADIYPTRKDYFYRIFDNQAGNAGFLLDYGADLRQLRVIYNGVTGVYSTNKFALNTWIKIVLTYDADAKLLTVTANGVECIRIENVALTPGTNIKIGSTGLERDTFEGLMTNLSLTVEDTPIFRYDFGGEEIVNPNRYGLFQALGNNAATEATPVYVEGPNGGRALNFNNDKFIQLSAAPLDMRNPFEFSAKIWYSWTGHHDVGEQSSMRLLDCSNGDTGFLLDIMAGDKLRLIGGTATLIYFADVPLKAETWIDFSFRYIPAEKRAIATANGAVIMDKVLTTALQSSTVPLRIGGDYGNGGITWWNFGGAMDDISIVVENLDVVESNPLESIGMSAENTLSLGEKTDISLSGTMSDGSVFSLDGAEIRLTSSNPEVLELRSENNRWTAIANAAGSCVVEAVYLLNGRSYRAELEFEVEIPAGIVSLVLANDGLAPRTADVARITVTGLGSAGEMYDLTYAATYSYDDSLITVNGAGHVRILKSGKGTLQAAIVSGGKRVEASTAFECERENLYSFAFKAGQSESQDTLGGSYTAKLQGSAATEVRGQGAAAVLTGGYVEILGSESMDFSDSFTLSADFYLEEFGQYFRLFDRKLSDTADYNGFMVDVRPNGALRFMQSNTLIDLTYVLPLRQWFRLTVSYDAQLSIARIYVDGEAVETIKNCKLTDVPTTLRVGADQFGTSQLYGKVADIEMSRGSIFFSGFSVNRIQVDSAADEISEDQGTMQFTATVMPESARNRTVTWTVEGTDGQPTLLASISEEGMLRAHADGTVVVKATARDGSAIFGSKEIRISSQKQQIYEVEGFDPDAWTANAGNWKLENGVLTQDAITWNTNYAFGEEIEHLSVQADFQFGDTNTEGFIGFQLLFDSNSQVMGRQNGFFAGVEASGRIFLYVSGRGEMDETPVYIPAFDVTKPFTLQVSMVDDHVAVSVNGSKILEHYNRELVSPEGTVAVFAGVKSVTVTNFSMQYLGSLSYTVAFDAQGGSQVASQAVKSGDAVQRPADPTYAGYVFGGWYTDSACTRAYDFSTAVEEDLVLYAKWTAETYTITFDSKGGSAVEQVTCVQGETLTAPQAPERKGYSFEGWYTDESCEHAYDFNSPVTGNMTLYAKWSKAGGCAGCGSGTAVPLTGALLLFAAGVLFKGRKH